MVGLLEILDEALELAPYADEVDRGPADHRRRLVVDLLEGAAQVLHRVLVAVGLGEGRAHARAELALVGELLVELEDRAPRRR